jgi:uncharacterized membrane protein (UPF0127 family)
VDSERLARLAATALFVLVLAVGGAFALGVVDLDSGPTTDDGAGGRTVEPTATVTVRAPDGATRAEIRVAVADSQIERYEGLSNTTPLDDGEGMLFVHDEESSYAYVMREMNYPLDIVFVGANGTVTTIHHADLPPEGTGGGDLERYRGRGKYVIEVPYGYTNETGIAVGDRVVLPARYR